MSPSDPSVFGNKDKMMYVVDLFISCEHWELWLNRDFEKYN